MRKKLPLYIYIYIYVGIKQTFETTTLSVSFVSYFETRGDVRKLDINVKSFTGSSDS